MKMFFMQKAHFSKISCWNNQKAMIFARCHGSDDTGQVCILDF